MHLEIKRTRFPLAAAAAALTLTVAACKPITLDGTESGDVVSGTSFSRSGSRETHYAECTTQTGEQYRVVVPATVEYQLQEGQPCPSGPREPMPQDKYPDLFEELQKQLPYGGGDRHSDCGEWQTVDKEEARRLAKQCPPLKWGDLR